MSPGFDREHPLGATITALVNRSLWGPVVGVVLLESMIGPPRVKAGKAVLRFRAGT